MRGRSIKWSMKQKSIIIIIITIITENNKCINKRNRNPVH